MSLTKASFGAMPDGTPVEIYSLENRNGFKVEVIPYGCRLVRIWSKDKNNDFSDVIWGYDTMQGYLVPRDSQGTAVGRFANRIANAELTIDGTSYALTPNEGKNQLHGGVSTGSGFAEKLWSVKETKDGSCPAITFSLFSPDGEGGFPGNMKIEITYTVTEDDALHIDYRAVCDKKTVINLTNHSYFNLGGYDSGSVHSHLLRIDADYYTVVDDQCIPTGEIAPVKGTALDFTVPKPIGQDIIKTGEGYNHNYAVKGYDNNLVLNSNGYREIAELYDPKSGRAMKVFTDLPGVQLYTANNIAPGKTGKGGAKMEPQCAVCLETQHFPDAMHHENFPNVFLEANQEFLTTTVYQFSVKN